MEWGCVCVWIMCVGGGGVVLTGLNLGHLATVPKQKSLSRTGGGSSSFRQLATCLQL